VDEQGVEAGTEKLTRKGEFRSKVELTKYYRNDVYTFEEVTAILQKIEDEHGVKFNKVGHSTSFKSALEEYVEKYGMIYIA